MFLKELQSLVASFPGLERLYGPFFSCGMLCHPSWRRQRRWQSKHHMQLNFKPSFLQLTPSGDLKRHLRACAAGLGQIVPDPAFFFVVFLSSNDWRTWINSAFCKTPLFKKHTSDRLSLLFISKVKIYNPLSALLLTLVCHFYHVLLRVAIFVLNVAIATDFLRRQTELRTKTLFLEIYRCKVVQFFTAQPLLLIVNHLHCKLNLLFSRSIHPKMSTNVLDHIRALAVLSQGEFSNDGSRRAGTAPVRTTGGVFFFFPRSATIAENSKKETKLPACFSDHSEIQN